MMENKERNWKFDMHDSICTNNLLCLLMLEETTIHSPILGISGERIKSELIQTLKNMEVLETLL